MIAHHINGKPVQSTTTFDTINPATQQVLEQVAVGGEAEVNAAVAAAKAAFPAWAGKPPPKQAIVNPKMWRYH
jgi:5-carboxymethyl-2-hydroxymuconic-semialdehyde dehydrogenase